MLSGTGRVRIYGILSTLILLLLLPSPALSKTTEQKKQIDRIIAQLHQRSRSSDRIYYQEISLIYRGLSIDPNNLTLLRNLAKIYSEIEYYQKAKETLEKIVKIDPKSYADKNFLLLTNEKIRKLKEKEKIFVSLLMVRPDDVSLRLKLIALKISFDDYKGALRLTETGLHDNPNSVSLLYIKAAIYLDLEKFNDAEKTIKKLLMLQPDNTTYKKLLAQTLKLKKQQIDALAEKMKKQRLAALLAEKNRAQTENKIKPYHIESDPCATLSKQNQAIIDQLLTEKKHLEAIQFIDKSLRNDPINLGLLYAKAKILTEYEQYKKAVWTLEQIFERQKEDACGLALLKKLEALDKRRLSGLNVITINNETADVKQTSPLLTQKDTWTYSLFTYYHQFQSGSLGGQVNQASRFGDTGFQYQIFYYPKLIGNSYAYLSYANSKSDLFPSNYYAGELYIPMSGYVTVSSGVSYYEILKTNLTLYTNSLTAYIGSYSLAIRPNHYVPKIGESTTYWLFTAKRYFDDPDNYIGLQYETGQTPDLADLSSIGFFTVSASVVRLFSQFHLGRGVFLQIGIGTSRETYFTDRIRTKFFGGLGLKFRF